MISILGVAVGLVVLAAVFVPVERLFPAVRGRAWRRRGLATDVTYWVVTAVLTKGVARLAVVLVVLAFAVAAGIRPDPAAIEAFVRSPGALVQRQPLWLQVIEVLLIGDLVGYWVHRAFHRGRLWRVHAVHHSSVDLDWLSAVRLHPVNDVVARVAQVIPVLLLGYPPTLLAAYVPFLGFYAIALHANVPWSPVPGPRVRHVPPAGRRRTDAVRSGGGGAREPARPARVPVPLEVSRLTTSRKRVTALTSLSRYPASNVS